MSKGSTHEKGQSGDKARHTTTSKHDEAEATRRVKDKKQMDNEGKKQR